MAAQSDVLHYALSTYVSIPSLGLVIAALIATCLLKAPSEYGPRFEESQKLLFFGIKNFLLWTAVRVMGRWPHSPLNMDDQPAYIYQSIFEGMLALVKFIYIQCILSLFIL